MSPLSPSRALIFASCLVGGAALYGCDKLPPLTDGFGTCGPASGDEGGAPSPTYHDQVKQIFDVKCVTCHSGSGSALGDLSTYTGAVDQAAAIKTAVQDGSMPPQPASSCCRPLRNDRNLTATQIAEIVRWVDQGTPEGTPRVTPTGPSSPTPNVSVPLSSNFLPVAVAGEAFVTRCFATPWNASIPGLVTAFRVAPGRADLYHRARVYVLNTVDLEKIFGSDAVTASNGWACGDMFTDPRPRLIGTSYPDQLGLEAPVGAGYLVTADQSLVVQVTYRPATAGSAPDSSKLEIFTSTNVQPLTAIAVFNPMWFLEDAMFIPAGNADVTHRFGFDLVARQGRTQLSAHGVSFELGPRGRAISAAILRGDGTIECLAHVPVWDRLWSRDVHFEKPVVFNPGDRFILECHWDNATAVDGIAPVDTWWGPGREICRATAHVVEVIGGK